MAEPDHRPEAHELSVYFRAGHWYARCLCGRSWAGETKGKVSNAARAHRQRFVAAGPDRWKLNPHDGRLV